MGLIDAIRRLLGGGGSAGASSREGSAANVSEESSDEGSPDPSGPDDGGSDAGVPARPSASEPEVSEPTGEADRPDTDAGTVEGRDSPADSVDPADDIDGVNGTEAQRGDDSMDEPTHEPVADGEAAEQAGPGAGTDEAELARVTRERAESFAADWPDYALDFSPASLTRLDELADAEFDHLAGETDPTQELLEAAVPLGAYFGEVVVRTDGARWVDRDGPVVVVTGEDGDVGTDVLQTAAGCVAGELSFVETRRRIVERQVE